MNKRQWFVLVTLAGLLGTLGFFLYQRLDGGFPQAVAASDDVSDSSDTEPDTSESPDDVDGDGDGETSPDDSEATVEIPPETLRVVGLGAESIAPGILANGGLEPMEDSTFAAASLEVHLRAESAVSAAERALSLGGDTDEGAHLIVLPMPSFVASYERLRALNPQIIAVAAWSHGRDALYGPASDSLMNPPRSRRGASTRLCGESGSPEVFFALYLLELSGKDIDEVTVEDRCGEGFRAHDRSGAAGSESGRLIATSADASTLVPWVVIAPASVIETPEDRQVVQRWLAGWFEGVSELRHHAAESARKIATATDSDPVRILQHLGQMHVADLGQNVRAFGLSGRGAITVSTLFGETWRVWREAGILVTPAPAASPVDSALVGLAARASAERPEAPSVSSASFETSPILQVALPSDDQSEAIHRVGWLADLFPRSAIEIQVPRGERQRDAMREEVLSRFGLEAGRVRATHHRQRRVVVYGIE